MKIPGQGGEPQDAVLTNPEEHTMQLSFYKPTTDRSLPKPGDEVRKDGREFTVTHVDAEDSRIVLCVVAHDTGLAGVLFRHECEAHFVR